MRIFGWLMLGLFVCHESLISFGRHQTFNESLYNLIMSPTLFLKGSLLMLLGLCLTAYALRMGLIVSVLRMADVRKRLIYGIIYSVTLLLGWGWLIYTTLLGGVVTIGLTLLLFFFWEKA